MTDAAANHEQAGGLTATRADLYEVLQISPRACQDVIQAAYRTLARAYHPDLNRSADAEERIRQLNAAYRVLSDPQEKAVYDLDCARARRADVPSRPDGTAQPGSPRPRYAVPSQLRPALARRPVEVRAPLVNGQLVLGFLAIAVLTALLLVLLWATFDPTSEYTPGYTDPNIDTVHHST